MSIYRVTLCMFLICVASCSQNDTGDDVIPESDVVTVDRVAVNLGKVACFNFTAQKEVGGAQAQIVKAKVHLAETESLIEDMKRNKSRYTAHITNLKDVFTKHVDIIEIHLIKTGAVLKSQIAALNQASKDLEVAKAKLAASEEEKKALRENNANLKKSLKDAEGYKDKYYNLLKYRWIVWGLGAWVLVKFLGGLGAWSPQGRIAKALIG